MASACSVEAVAELLLEAPLYDADVALAGAVGYRAVLLNLLEDGRRRLRLALVKGVPGAFCRGDSLVAQAASAMTSNPAISVLLPMAARWASATSAHRTL